MAAVNVAIRRRRNGVAVPRAAASGRRQPPVEAGYQHFRLDRQGALVSPKTLEYYDGMVLPFLRWLEAEEVRRFE